MADKTRREKVEKMMISATGKPSGRPGTSPPSQIPVNLTRRQKVQQMMGRNLNFGMPTSPYDQQQYPEEPYGIPEDWDYKTAKKGPNGENLPNKAVSWTPQGEPFYGTNNAFTEWLAGFKNKVTEPFTKTSSEYLDTAKNYTYSAFKEEGDGTFFEGVGTAIEFYKNVFDGIFSKEKEVGDEPGGLAQFARKTGQTIVGAGELLNIGAVELEKGINVADYASDLAGVMSIKDDEVLVKQLANLPDNFTGNATRFLVRSLEGLIDTVLLPYSTLNVYAKMGLGELDPEEVISGIENAYQSGRIMYSSLIVPAVEAEFISRYEEGEHPYLLALELQDPLAEMAGQIIFDPLNLLGVVGKGRSASRSLSGFQQDLLKFAPEVADVARTADVARGANWITDFAESVQTFYRRVGTETLEYSRKNAMFGLTSGGKRNYLNRISSDMLSVMSNTVKGDVDKTMDMINAIVKTTSSNVDEVAEGIVELGKMNVPLNMILSETGGKFALVMKEMGGGDVLAFVRKYQDVSTAKFIEAVDTKMMKAVDRIFPTLSEQAEMGVRLGAQGTVYRGFEAVANTKFMRSVNNAFSRVFMGLNPGYAARNSISGNFHVFIDSGGSAWVHGGEYLSINKVRDQIQDLTRGLGAKASTQGIGLAGGATGVTIDMTAPTMALAQWSEKNIGARSFLEGFRNAFEKMMPKAFDQQVSILKNAGFSNDSIRSLQSLMKANTYKIDEVMKIYKEAHSLGIIDVFKTGEWISSDLADGIHALKMEPSFYKVLNEAESLEDFQKGLYNLFDELEDLGDSNTGYSAFIGAEDAGIHTDEFERLAQAGRTFGLDSGVQGVNTNARVKNIIFEQRAEELLGTVLTVGKELGPEAAAKVDELLKSPKWASIVDGTFLKASARNNTERLLDPVWFWTNQVRAGKATPDQAWFDLIGANPPQGLTKRNFLNYLWEGHYYPQTRQYFMGQRQEYWAAVESIMNEVHLASGGTLLPEIEVQLNKALFSLSESAEFDHVIIEATKYGAESGIGIRNIRFDIPEHYNEYIDGLRLALLNNIPTATAEGVPTKTLLNLINKELKKDYKSLADIPFTDFEQALKFKRGDDFIDLAKPFGKYADDITERTYKAVNVRSFDPSDAEWAFDQKNLARDVKAVLFQESQANWGKKRQLFQTEDMSKALDEFEKMMIKRETESLMVANEYGTAQRHFAMLDYGARENFDTILGTVMPYQLFYNRTFRNWAKRVARDPKLLANYSRYKNTLAKLHANTPDWWKYQINTNELLGLDMENPFYFSLEAMLNPMNGLMGVDYDDPDRRVDNWTRFLDGANKFGPTVHPLIQLATTFDLYRRGEEEAAAHWGNAMFPGFRAATAIDALIGDDPVSDYSVMGNLFQGGIDPGTRKRMGRAGITMVQEGIMTMEEYIDAARSQSGEHWEMMHERAVQNRAPGQLFSFFLGTGFTARTQDDKQIDAFYQELRYIQNVSPDMSDEEIPQMYDELRAKYPFMDGILLARKGDEDRDSALAWNVLSRIPPSSEFLREIGYDNRLIQKFYDDRGNINEWAEGDRNHFMGMVVDLAAALAIPDQATKAEWNGAMAMNKEIMADVEFYIINTFPELNLKKGDLDQLIDGYYANFSDDPDSPERARAYIEAHPEVAEALDYKASLYTRPENELAAIYYASYSQMENYYRSQMYEQIDIQFGANIWQINDGYFRSENKREYLVEHDILKSFWATLDYWKELVVEKAKNFMNRLPEIESLDLREGFEAESFGQEDIEKVVEP